MVIHIYQRGSSVGRRQKKKNEITGEKNKQKTNYFDIFDKLLGKGFS